MGTIFVVLLVIAAVGVLLGLFVCLLTLYVRQSERRSGRMFARSNQMATGGGLPIFVTEPDGPRHKRPLSPFHNPKAVGIEDPKLARVMPEKYGAPAPSWDEATPWKPGDPAVAGPAPYATQAPRVSRIPELIDRGGERGLAHLNLDDETTSAESRRRTRDDSGRRSQSWWSGIQWSEDSRKYQPGERIRSTTDISNDLGLLTVVPKRTDGRIISTRIDMYGNEKTRVAFKTGYTGEVDARTIERRRWYE